MEKIDIRKAYLDSDGCFKYIQRNVPFIEAKDKSRIKKIVEDMDK